MKPTTKFALEVAGAGVLTTGLAATVLADSLSDTTPTGITNIVGPDHGQTDLGEAFKKVSNTLIVIVITISVIMLIVGGLRYVLSSGNSSSVEGAKNTILYAVIGIIVALLAAAIVNFVVGKFAA